MESMLVACDKRLNTWKHVKLSFGQSAKSDMNFSALVGRMKLGSGDLEVSNQTAR